MLTKICTTALAWIGAGLFVWFVLWITVIGSVVEQHARFGRRMSGWEAFQISVWTVLLWPLALALAAWECVSPVFGRGRR